MTPAEALEIVRSVLRGTVDSGTVTDVRPALTVLEGVVVSEEDLDDDYQRGYSDGYEAGSADSAVWS